MDEMELGGPLPCPDLPNDEYNIPGESPFFQVSPEASVWTEKPVLSTVLIDDLEHELGTVPPYPPKGSEEYREEEAELRTRYENRYESLEQCELSVFLRHPLFVARPPAGAVLNNRVHTGRLPIVKNGAELATLFEAEKTAVWHQHVLLTLLDLPGKLPDEIAAKAPAELRNRRFRLREVISPVRQALMQAALHMSVFSALAAVWRFKWRETKAAGPVERRQRPAEAIPGLSVLFDSEIRFDQDGSILRDLENLKQLPETFPGSPRHPAYGSGHSTYSRAASDVLKAFLPKNWGDPEVDDGLINIHRGLDRLAENIGEARIWGGVHWRSDHTFGRRIGAAIARQVIRQLDASLIEPPSQQPLVWQCPPSREELEKLLTNPRQKQPWSVAPSAKDFERNIQGQAG